MHRPDLDGLRIRDAVRPLVLDPDDRVLLVRFEFPDGTRWALPGGGLEPGETRPRRAAPRARRGARPRRDVEIGPHVWDRLHIIPFINGQWDGQRERIHLVRAAGVRAVSRGSAWEQLNAEYHVRGALVAAARPRRRAAVRARRRCTTISHRLLRDGPPNQPVDVGRLSE